MVLGLTARFWALIQEGLTRAARAASLLSRGTTPAMGGHASDQKEAGAIAWEYGLEYCIPDRKSGGREMNADTTKVLGVVRPRVPDEAHRLAIEPIDTSFSFKNKAYAALKNVTAGNVYLHHRFYMTFPPPLRSFPSPLGVLSDFFFFFFFFFCRALARTMAQLRREGFRPFSAASVARICSAPRPGRK